MIVPVRRADAAAAGAGRSRRPGSRSSGRRPASIDLAEDRGKFAELLRELDIPAPEHGEANDLEEARAIAGADRVPGRRAAVLRARRARDGDRRTATTSSSGSSRAPRPQVARSSGADRPVPRGRDRDRRRRGVRRHGRVHRRRDGAHRGGGDPLRRLVVPDPAGDAVRRRAGRGRAHHANASPCGSDVRRPASTCSSRVKDERIWVLEANPRASRTVPFVSKVDRGAARQGRDVRSCWVGRSPSCATKGSLPAEPRHYLRLPHTAVKAAVLPFGRFPGVDTLLGPEMRSTGEVMGIDADSGTRARQGAGRERRLRCRREGTIFLSRREPGQAVDPVPGQAPGRSRLPPARDAGHGRRARTRRDRRLEGLQGLRGRTLGRRPHPRRRGRPGREHAVRSRPAHRRVADPRRRRAGGHPVHHYPARPSSRRSAESSRCVAREGSPARCRSTTRPRRRRSPSRNG